MGDIGARPFAHAVCRPCPEIPTLLELCRQICEDHDLKIPAQLNLFPHDRHARLARDFDRATNREFALLVNHCPDPNGNWPGHEAMWLYALYSPRPAKGHALLGFCFTSDMMVKESWDPVQWYLTGMEGQPPRLQRSAQRIKDTLAQVRTKKYQTPAPGPTFRIRRARMDENLDKVITAFAVKSHLCLIPSYYFGALFGFILGSDYTIEHIYAYPS